MPWIRRIWIVVNKHFERPEVLPSGVHIIKESVIVPKKFLPTIWNSNVTESWIWAIPGLSEKFIYFCDDMYIGKPVQPSDFFGQEDMPILRANSCCLET